jgi:large subunit ribosomal protein L30
MASEKPAAETAPAEMPAPKQAPAKKAPAKKAASKQTPVKKTSVKKASAKKSVTGSTVKVTLVRSLINTRSDHRATVRGLGLRRLNDTVELEDTPAVRGMINKVIYLLRLGG